MQKISLKIKNLYPITKIWITLNFVILAIGVPTLTLKLICFMLLNILAFISGMYKTFISILLSTIGVMTIFMIVLQALFHPSTTILFEFWIFSIKTEGIWYAASLTTVLLTVGGSFIWFFSVTSQKDFIVALEQEGLDPKAAYVVLATLQMVPLLHKKSSVIMDAQKSRGMETEGNLWVRVKAFFSYNNPFNFKYNC